MSGGTDSSVAAALLVEQGYEVIGLTAHMWKEGSRCCSLEDVARAQKVCAALGIRHYVVNAQDRFEKHVVSPFVEGYAAGITPSPCISCNQFIKFGFLLDRAAQLDCDILATGHYAQIEERDGQFHLLRAVDPKKDQSYFLHRLSQKQLARIAFPLGGWTKPEVKKWSDDHDLPIIPRGESQDLCFVEAGKYAEFVEGRAPEVKKPGNVLDDDGNVLAEHDGVHRFTVGQRGGTGVATGERVYVSDINADENTITLSPRENVMASECIVTDAHWISGCFPDCRTGFSGTPESLCSDADTRSLREACPTKTKAERHFTVQPRYGHGGAPAMIEKLSGTEFRVIFDQPQFALTPGQAAVVYSDTECLGGGWIK
ncbi:MAG: tRNA 2-thiouridine(34) synthase MnmA [Kiritimatiellales bacterium]|nr:tRNA 2-thiouridine(34) synthase MnmA [Kiritimatiellota bacterium]MBL7012468.1 tRNA 2-thiouridine(34) synthase MnmA [Kiritimatiellales bacterium]